MKNEQITRVIEEKRNIWLHSITAVRRTVAPQVRVQLTLEQFNEYVTLTARNLKKANLSRL